MEWASHLGATLLGFIVGAGFGAMLALIFKPDIVVESKVRCERYHPRSGDDE